MSISLTGTGLTPQEVEAIAQGASVTLNEHCLEVMERSRRIIEKAAGSMQAVYGVTTGLGPKVVQTLPDDSIDSFSISTIRGRSHGVGETMPARWVRAGMAVRLNTLLTGAAGARPVMAEHLALCLNRQFTPSIPKSGTIGVADLHWGGAFGSALIGEGSAINSHGAVSPAIEVLRTVSVPVFRPELREGLALVSHSCFTGGIAALSLCALEQSYQASQIASALSMEGFRANVSALDERVLRVRPQQGQLQTAAQLLRLLHDSPLLEAGSARRLQDPLSIRNIAQVHGTVQATLNAFAVAVADEINGASDNPAVLPDDEEILSHGGYLPVYLCTSLGSLLQAFVHLAALQVSRVSKLLFERFSGLTNGLTAAGSDGAGLAPLMKTAESLFAEISHLATPAPAYPGISADSLEDIVTHTAIPVQAALSISTKLNYLAAIEMLVALQAIDIRKISQHISPRLQIHYRQLRKLTPLVNRDRPLGGEIESLADLITQGELTL